MKKKIESLAELVFTFANVGNERLMHLMYNFSGQENLLFPKTDQIWSASLAKNCSQNDSVDLAKSFSYEINDYLAEAKAENPLAYNELELNFFYDESANLEEVHSNSLQDAKAIWEEYLANLPFDTDEEHERLQQEYFQNLKEEEIFDESYSSWPVYSAVELSAEEDPNKMESIEDDFDNVRSGNNFLIS